MTRVAETELDRHFALLSLALHARSHAAPAPRGAPALSSYLPSSLARARAAAAAAAPTDPQDLFRALSRIDALRPPGKVGDAARRAVREVRRAHSAAEGGVVQERRLTGVPPPTPRKPPGTPRRATTPGKGR